jgi:hypothetical protein
MKKSLFCKKGYDTRIGKIIRGNSYLYLLEYNEWYVIVDENKEPCVFLKSFFD